MEEAQMDCMILNADEFPRLQYFHCGCDQALHCLKEIFHALLRGQDMTLSLFASLNVRSLLVILVLNKREEMNGAIAGH